MLAGLETACCGRVAYPSALNGNALSDAEPTFSGQHGTIAFDSRALPGLQSDRDFWHVLPSIRLSALREVYCGDRTCGGD